MVWTPSIGMRNGRSVARPGQGCNGPELKQLRDAPAGLGVAGPLEAALALPRTNGVLVAVESVFRQQITSLHLHEVDQLGVVHEIDLVDEDDEVGDADLAGQEDVLAGLRHRAVGRRDQQDRAVHLGRAGDHVLDIIGVARAVDMGVVPLSVSYSTWLVTMVTVLVASRTLPPLLMSW